MSVGTLPKVDGDLFYFPPPDEERDDNCTEMYFYSEGTRFTAQAEMTDEGIVLHWDGFRIPFQSHWNMIPVDKVETLQ